MKTLGFVASLWVGRVQLWRSTARFSEPRLSPTWSLIQLAVIIAVGMHTLASPVRALDKEFNLDGNILISDQYNNRVIEVNSSGHIVWQFGLGPNDASPSSILGVRDARRLGAYTLMAGTHIPPGVSPAFPDGAIDNRVILVDPYGEVVWQYGQFGVIGSGDNELNMPTHCVSLPNHDILITDSGNHRVIMIGANHQIVWQYGTTGVAGSGQNYLSSPSSAEYLFNGNILIADTNNNRVIEVDSTHRLVAEFTAGNTLSGVAFASRLPGQWHTLITDSNNSRVVEVDKYDQIVWQYVTNRDSRSNDFPMPSRAVRLQSGQTLISDQFNDRVMIVDPLGNIDEHYGYLNSPGYGRQTTGQGLNAPTDAKVIGDDTGLTLPTPEIPPFTQIGS